MRVRTSVVIASLILSLSAFAADTKNIVRLENGKPNLSGVWQVFNRANNSLVAQNAQAAHAMKAGDLGPVPADKVLALGAVGSVAASLGVVEGNNIPYTVEARKQQQLNRDNWLNEDPEVKCYLPGIPRATYMPYPFQIFHNEDAVFFAYEYAGATRDVFLTDPGPAPIDSWMGQSVGTWDGDTFVVTVTGQNDQTWFDRAGNFHTVDLKVTESFTPTSEHTMNYVAVIEDKAIFTEPWTMSMTLYKRVEKDAQLQQFKCVEFVEELLYGHLRKGAADE